MQSSLIGKIEKARRYAEEKDRVTFQSFSLKFRGEHSNYLVTSNLGAWHCTCSFFSKWNTCSHTMATQRILGGMLAEDEPSLAATTY
ncbi:MAG: hypothetical protein HYY29_00335 [Chloroflexi bacterium]|nr:hypothetical protein [Chloroflexota bacterium]